MIHEICANVYISLCIKYHTLILSRYKFKKDRCIPNDKYDQYID